MIGLGCMRLSTAPARDDSSAVRVIHAALDAGVGLLDTADAYAFDDLDLGHNERLIARVLAERSGDRERITVATKGGLTRPGGHWVPNGRAKHLRAACERSLVALGVERIDLYQLHVPDPDVDIEVSVRALGALKKEGKIAEIGLCNATVEQIERARAVTEIASVQIALGPYAEAGFRGGVPEYCIAHGLRLIAHSPLGGPAKKRALERHRVLGAIARARGVTSAEIVLAWLIDLSPAIVPIAGATRPVTAQGIGHAQKIVLLPEERAAIDQAFPFAELLRTSRASRRPKDPRGEVVLLMGIQASGKSTAVEGYVGRGYRRLNRDAIGGRMSKVHERLDMLLLSGERRIVLDNTYPTRASRNEAVEIAWRRGAAVRCVWLDTPIEQAQINAVLRMHQRYGALLDPASIRRLAKTDPNAFGPGVQYRFLEQLERPEVGEGFESVEVVPFQRSWPPDHRGRALFLELDGVLRRSRSGKRTPSSAEDVDIDRRRAEALKRMAGRWDAIIGLAWLPEIAAKTMTVEVAREVFRITEEALGIGLEHAYCPHGPGPAICWCRRPLPGLGVAAIVAHRLDPGASVMVGLSAQDRGFAARLGLRFEDPESFFGAQRERH